MKAKAAATRPVRRRPGASAQCGAPRAAPRTARARPLAAARAGATRAAAAATVGLRWSGWWPACSASWRCTAARCSSRRRPCPCRRLLPRLLLAFAWPRSSLRLGRHPEAHPRGLEQCARSCVGACPAACMRLSLVGFLLVYIACRRQAHVSCYSQALIGGCMTALAPVAGL